jgi:hypothetical protein
VLTSLRPPHVAESNSSIATFLNLPSAAPKVGPSVKTQNLGDGSPLQHWQIVVAPTTLKFNRDLPFASPADKAAQPQGALLNVAESLSLTHGKIGLGGWARTPVWENFHFETP